MNERAKEFGNLIADMLERVSKVRIESNDFLVYMGNGSVPHSQNLKELLNSVCLDFPIRAHLEDYEAQIIFTKKQNSKSDR